MRLLNPWCAAAAVMLFHPAAFAVQYDFRLVGPSSAAAPVINNRGWIAWYARDPSGGGPNLRVWDGQSSQQVLTNDSPDTISSQPLLNDNGLAVMMRTNSRDILAWDPTSGPRTLYTGQSNLGYVTSVNNSGQITLATLGAGKGRISIADGTTVTPAFDLLYNVVTPRMADIGDDGTLAVVDRDNQGVFWKATVLRNGVQLLSLSSDQDYTNLYAPSVSDNGIVVLPYRKGTAEGVLKFDHGVLTEVVGPSTPSGSTTVFSASVNNRGDTAYFTPLNQYGIYVNDKSTGKVIARGDPLFGSSVSFLELSTDAINDAGQVAFHATLADGRIVAVIATPVPEPGALIGLSSALLILSRRRRRHAHQGFPNVD